MHPLTRFFNYLKRKDFALALAREHLSDRDLTEWSLEYLRSQKIENVHLICGFSDKVDLPECCEVLVHSLVGDIGSSEGTIEFVEDAKRRLLTTGAIHIPQRCITYVVLAEDPKLRLAQYAWSGD